MWLIERSKSGKPLPRRQELPPEAFVDVEALRRAWLAAPLPVRTVVLPLISISLQLLLADGPTPADAQGKQLRHVATVLHKNVP
eukprot:1820521-Prymnesium_polylepis.1